MRQTGINKRLIRIGGSRLIVIPKFWLSIAGIEKDERVNLRIDEAGHLVMQAATNHQNQTNQVIEVKEDQNERSD